MRAKQRAVIAEANAGVTPAGEIDAWPRVEAMEEAEPKLKKRTKASSKKK
tara:strand:- start:445 stop:594 length:150 start_codon:yes stop_codon:yes gene_type:complete